MLVGSNAKNIVVANDYENDGTFRINIYRSDVGAGDRFFSIVFWTDRSNHPNQITIDYWDTFAWYNVFTLN